MSICNKTKKTNKGSWNTSSIIEPKRRNKDGTITSVFEVRVSNLATDYEASKLAQMGVTPKMINEQDYFIDQRLSSADSFELQLKQMDEKIKSNKQTKTEKQ